MIGAMETYRLFVFLVINLFYWSSISSNRKKCEKLLGENCYVDQKLIQLWSQINHFINPSQETTRATSIRVKLKQIMYFTQWHKVLQHSP